VNVIAGIEQLLNAALGLRERASASARLGRELEQLRHELGLDAEEVLRRLPTDARLVRRLACALTVEETFFFRHPEHFEWLVEHVRGRLQTSAAPVSVWSAGCSSGEEPYSMVIALHRALGPESLSRVSIVATDVDARGLSRARQGVYSEWSFRGTSPRALRAYLDPDWSAGYRLTEKVREAVRFEHLSLQERLASMSPGSLDVIFCRNVAIYMTDEALADLYAGFARALRVGGLLVLGPADPLPRDGAFVRSRVHDMFVHRKAPRREPRPPMPGLLLEAPGLEAALPVSSRPPPRLVPYPERASRDAAQQRAVLTEAHRLADRGLTGQALAALSEQLERGGRSAELLGLRGRIHLAQGDACRGAEDLRAALDLNPSDTALRFHYALALEALQDCGACRAQLQTLLSCLEARSDAEALEPEELALDGAVTTVGSLRRAAHELLRRVE
jgi:chemotaxis protein methyltransferase CheR